MFFQKKKAGTVAEFAITGMHCTSCALTIDNEIEDLPGVIGSKTNFARSTVQVEYDSEKISPNQFKRVVNELGYAIIDKPIT